MPTTSIQQPYKARYCLVRFYSPGTTSARYTDNSSDVSFTEEGAFGTNTFTATAQMSIKVPPLMGGATADETLAQIELTLDPYAAGVSGGYPHERILVRVWEVMDSDLSGSATTITLFRGRVAMADRIEEEVLRMVDDANLSSAER